MIISEGGVDGLVFLQPIDPVIFFLVEFLETNNIDSKENSTWNYDL